jgi:hypothetical protein
MSEEFGRFEHEGWERVAHAKVEVAAAKKFWRAVDFSLFEQAEIMAVFRSYEKPHENENCCSGKIIPGCQSWIRFRLRPPS